MDRILLSSAGRLRSLQSASLRRPAWVCSSCRHNGLLRPSRARAYATTSAPQPATEVTDAASHANSKPYYVTTPIFYVNASPHIGHMYTMILADVLKRWHKLKGRQSLLLTGTDEHGMKVQQAAENHDTPPKEWCDIQAEKFKQLAAKTNLANDFFIRTTDEDHKESVRHFWFLLKEKGLIYESKHEGWYCVSDETFYPESMLDRKVDPLTGDVSLASIESGNSVEWTEEKNYHFRMSALKDQLLDFYQRNPDFIVPRSRMREVVHWVQNNLEDLSISRPSSRLNWGIRVPGDDTQTIYVWVDALINYLTKAGFPNWTPGRETDGGWPADVHVIGKDIVRFHGVYWPALLLAVGISPPKKLLSHAHWTMNGRKMSKSLGNVVNPYYAIDRWGVDTMRLFMMLDGGIENDANYDNKIIVQRYKKVLAGTFGNLLSRVTRSKAWNVRESVQAAPMLTASLHHSRLDEMTAALFEAQKAKIDALYGEMDKFMENPDPRRALMVLTEVAFEANRFISEMAPWAMSRGLAEKSPEEQLRLNALKSQTIYIMAETLRNTGILLQPYMPEKAQHLLDVLGVPEENRSFEYCGFGKDSDYGVPMRDPGKSAHESLFPPLEVED
ncbi:methionyl-trna synthetase [Diaporthe eres]|nr:methionyl-trna synthetase [Diaporthe eres]